MYKNSTILIIDDLSSSVKMIENFLSEYRVLSATSGDEGLELAKKYQPDLILLDVIMPGMTGFEVCEELKRNGELRDIPVIFLTTCNRREDIDRSFDLGAFDYITKPISGKALRAKIHAVFSILDKIRNKRIYDNTRKNEANEIFVKGMSHNFNNMFGGIIGMAQLLEKLETSEAKVARYAKMIRTTAENGAKLVAQLLEFSQSSDFSFERIDIKDVLDSVCRYALNEINSAFIFKYKFAAENSFIVGDPDKLFMVFKNLLLNANDAIDNDFEIVVGTENVTLKENQSSKYGIEPGDYLKVYISDHGCGIGSDIIGKIFEPFFSTSDLSEAKGLGLAEARGIINGHRGAIDCLNKSSGGAEFYILLPLSKKLVSPVIGEEFVDNISSEGKILLVDDEEISLLFAQEMLRKSGYSVETAVNGEEALALYRVDGANIDLVLSDIIMPRMNGIELASELRKLNSNVRIILMTGHSLDLEEKDIDFIKGIIKKPFRGAEIINLINSVLAAE